VREFLQSENRHSVQSNGRDFLQEINQWDDDLFTTPEGTQTVDIIENLADSDDFDISSFMKEVESEDSDSI